MLSSTFGYYSTRYVYLDNVLHVNDTVFLIPSLYDTWKSKFGGNGGGILLVR